MTDEEKNPRGEESNGDKGKTKGKKGAQTAEQQNKTE